MFVKLYGLDGNFAAFLDNASDVVHEEVLDGNDKLTFELPGDDDKAALVIEDCEVEYEARRFIVTDVTRSRDPQVNLSVSCEATYIELLDRAKLGKYELTAQSALEGLTSILLGTGWTIGTVDDDGLTKYSLSEQDRTVLWLVRTWARIAGLEVEWDTAARTVSLVEQIGDSNGVAFRYAKNLKSARKAAKAPLATRLYPYGRNGVSIKSVNGGVAYLEDYSWYTDRGLSLAEATARFRKDFILRDDRFLDAVSLKRYAQKQLAQLAHGTVAYDATVLDVAELTGVTEAFGIGDVGLAHDTGIDVDVLARIVRYRRFHSEPWRNEVELNYLVPGLDRLAEDASLSGEVGLVGEQLVFAQNVDPFTVTTTPLTTLTIALTAFDVTNGEAGINIVGTASTTTTLTVEVLYDTDVVQTFPWPVHSGQNTVAIPFIFLSIPEGSKNTRLRLAMASGTFTVAALKGSYWIKAKNLLGGAADEDPDVIVFDNVPAVPAQAVSDPTVSAAVQYPIGVDTSASVLVPAQAADDATVNVGLTAIVTASADDGFITATPSFDNSAASVEAGASGGVARSAFLRFPIGFAADLAGRTIDEATIEGIADTSDTGALLKIRADDDDTPAAPTDKTDMDGRTRTTAAVDWDPAATTAGVLAKTGNFASVVQELVDSYGSAITHILVFIEDDGSPTNGRFTMRSQDHATSAEPMLRITFH